MSVIPPSEPSPPFSPSFPIYLSLSLSTPLFIPFNPSQSLPLNPSQSLPPSLPPSFPPSFPPPKLPPAVLVPPSTLNLSLSLSTTPSLHMCFLHSLVRLVLHRLVTLSRYTFGLPVQGTLEGSVCIKEQKFRPWFFERAGPPGQDEDSDSVKDGTYCTSIDEPVRIQT